MKTHGDGTRPQRCGCGAAHLTAREVQVLLLVAAGFGGHAIGHELGISSRTVEDHLAVMRRRTGARDSAELVARCYAAEILLPAWPPQWSGKSCLLI
jgi:DNA-binding NarL/FixJ family response regulator